jgi:hypothetical protein
MKAKAPPSDKTPMERFNELGKKLMAVPKTEVDRMEKKWHQQKPRRTKRKP